MTPPLDAALAQRLATIALGHVRREYPNHLGHVLTGPADARTPRELHPVFYGSYDWHSCVHAYWMLAHLLRRFPEMAAAADIGALFDAQLQVGKVQQECDYLARPQARGFERPYGWAWLLKLAAELHSHAPMPWAQALAPLAQQVLQGWREFLPRAGGPVRTGSHGNTAFALRLMADYASATADQPLLQLLGDSALRWYGADHAAPAWGEPGGDDFLSPTLVEAECMRRLLPPADFRPWLDRFLPHLAQGQPATLFKPVASPDRSDGKLAHLDGLNLSRAWCWRSLALALPPDDPLRAPIAASAQAHLAAGLPHVSGHYMGEHWLASFAVLALG